MHVGSTPGVRSRRLERGPEAETEVASEPERKSLGGARRLHRIRVRRVMSLPPVAIEADATLLEAERLMDTHEVDCLPVVEKGQLVGIVTRADVEGLAYLRSFRLFH